MDTRLAGCLVVLTLATPTLALADWGAGGGAQISSGLTPDDPVNRTIVAGSWVIWAGGSRVFVRYVPQGPQSAPAPVAACDGDCAGGGVQANPVAAVSDNGDLFVAWEDSRATCSPSCFGVYAQVFCHDNQTVPSWPFAFRVSTSQQGDTPKTALAIASTGNGRTFVAWEDATTGSSQIAGRFLATDPSCSAAAPTDSAFLLAPAASGDQTNPDVALDGTGGAIVVWEQVGNEDDIYGQHVTVDGTLQWGTAGGAICALPNSQKEPAIASDGLNGAIVAWRGLGDSSTDDVFATRICPMAGSSPAFLWGNQSCSTNAPPPVRVCVESGEQKFPVIVPDGSHGAYIAWEDARPQPGNPGGYAIYCQRLDENGGYNSFGSRSLWITNGEQVYVSSQSQYRPSMAPSDDIILNNHEDKQDGVTLAWYNGDSGSGDIYVQRIGKLGQLGMASTLVCDLPPAPLYDQIQPGVGYVPGGAIIAWHDARSNSSVYGTLRGNPDLVAVEPGPSALSFASAWPNPFRASVTFRLGLPEAEDVRLEVFDLLGRKVRTIVRGRFDPGPHTFQWDGRSDRGEVSAAGIYLVRARVGGQVFHQQVVRLQ
jgi:hypothetical protein